MQAFDMGAIDRVLLASGWHTPDRGSLRWRTATRWIDDQPVRMVEWAEGGVPVFSPVVSILAVQSAVDPVEEPVRSAYRDPVADVLDGAGSAFLDSDAAARTNDVFAGRPGWPVL